MCNVAVACPRCCSALPQGVRICVLLYREVASVLPLNSLHSEDVLSALHPNIMVVRHRSRFGHNISWSHHEKIVCVDQSCAFIGGLDLALMRWDTAEHPLTDTSGSPRWIGKDYANPRSVAALYHAVLVSADHGFEAVHGLFTSSHCGLHALLP